MSQVRAVVLVATVLLLPFTSANASAQSEPLRQSFELTFTSQRPNDSTGFSELIDYVNPADPEAKPLAVQRIVVELASGAKIDTSVPERCTAPDPVLIAEGPNACPAGSRVGAGQVDLDTGLPGPTRILRNDVTLLNNTGEVIFVFQPQGGVVRAVSRATIEGRSFITEAPPIPGGPPDGFTAIDRVALDVVAVSTGSGSSRKAYITTPASCPASRSWTNTARFTYRDNVTQTVASDSPCAGRRLGNGGKHEREADGSPEGGGRSGGGQEFPRGGVEAGRVATAPAAGGWPVGLGAASLAAGLALIELVRSRRTRR